VTSPTPITGATPHSGRLRTRRRGRARGPDSPGEQEYGRDVWRPGELGIDDRRPAHISVENIPQPWLKDLARRWARWRLTTGSGAAAAAPGTRAAARFAASLADPGVNAGHLARWSTPDHRLITVILMRCGLRIGDALGCLAAAWSATPAEPPICAASTTRWTGRRLSRSARSSSTPPAASTSVSTTAGPRKQPCCSRGPPAIPTAAIRWGTRTTAGHYAAG